MSSTSKMVTAVPVVKPRLITVGRGRAPLNVQTESRPGAGQGTSVPQFRLRPVPDSVQVRTVGRDCDLLASGDDDSQLGLRRPKIVQQEPSQVVNQFNNNLTEENHQQSSGQNSSLLKNKRKMGVAVIGRTGAGGAPLEQQDQLEKMKEELAVFKEESGANLELLKKQVEKLQEDNDKDVEITRLKTELEISKKLLDIQANIRAKKESVLAEVSPPPPGNVFQFPDRPQYFPPGYDAPPPVRGAFVPQPVSPPPPPPPPVCSQAVRNGLGIFAPGSQSSQQAAPPQPPPGLDNAQLARPLFDQPLGGEEREREGGSALSYFSSNQCDEDRGVEVDGVVYNVSFIVEQEKIMKQLVEKNRRKQVEETQSLELIQQLSIEEEPIGANSSGPFNRTNHQNPTSNCESFNHKTSKEMNDSWTKVAKTVRRPLGTPGQEKTRMEKQEVEEQRRQRTRQYEEWRRELKDKEEKERANILQSHLDSQKVRMIKESPSSEVVRGSNKSPAVTSGTSVAPVQALTLGDIVPNGRRHKAAPRQSIGQRSQRQTEVSEFEAERRKAAIEVKKRIAAQVILVH